MIPRQKSIAPHGLTVLEILVSVAILGMVMLAIGASIGTMQNLWVRTRGKIDPYRGVRTALDTIQRRVQQATLATRLGPDIAPGATDDGSAEIQLQSDLHFVCGPADELLPNLSDRVVGDAIFFQGPLGQYSKPESGFTEDDRYDTLQGTLSAWGYFVECIDDEAVRPTFLAEQRPGATATPSKRRFRLMEFRQPAHELTLFQPASAQDEHPSLRFLSDPLQLHAWFRTSVQSANPKLRHVSMVADNVLAVVITPFDPGLTDSTQFQIGVSGVYDTRMFQYGSSENPAVKRMRHRLPPAIRLTVIATSGDHWDRMLESEANQLTNQLTQVMRNRFRDPANWEDDMAAISVELSGLKSGGAGKPRSQMPFRIFNISFDLGGH
jgi:uncharacterized protein (TIGR02599 family)